ncbi:MAG: hypothetical protein J6H21_02655 [Firmicutes bacterium]|nr:hypothetical protein [Bacillota bacterium]
MENKRFNTLMQVHFILLLLLCAVTVFGLAFIIIKGISLPFGIILIHISLILSLLCGLIYVRKDYQKNASIFYKAFILFTAISDAILVYTTISKAGFSLGVAMICVRILLLLIMVFGKDLGKTNTWILFYIVLAIDLLYGILFIPRGYLISMTLVDVIGKLVIDGTIGLAIRGKYADKEARYGASQQ